MEWQRKRQKAPNQSLKLTSCTERVRPTYLTVRQKLKYIDQLQYQLVNPTFITDRLIVRPRQYSDLEQCLLMDQDPKVTKYLQGPWSDPVNHRTFVTERINNKYPKGLGYWSVFNKLENENQLLGWVLLLPYHLFEDEVEIGWRFIQESWGKGYATEAASIILDYAFSTIGLQKIVADINPLNVSSINVAEKLGMHYVEDRDIDGIFACSYQIKHTNGLEKL